ncbi:AAA family ATPase [Endozoicomonas sp. 4G]|uniref:AAA family ATPase n=1 Tax=Endozoicomonas sp. 4G TaxID=2872754 RepID=UPI0020790C94|nr:AAA family ATPase [Endozoicomonas sp. 4G]
MDGKVGGNINEPLVKRDMPDSDGVPAKSAPAKRARLDLSLNRDSKKIKACSQAVSRLRISPPSVTPPGKPRTVSSTDTSCQKSSHAFDFRFVASDDEVRQLLAARTCDEHQDVTVISHPDDLSQANLLSRLSISQEGRHTLSSGKLFEGSQPLTMVIDIRKLTGEELPKFNDLLDPDNPCLYDKVSQEKRPLGEHVSLLVLAAPDQLTSVGQREDAPGADFWRRINRPDNTWQFDAQTHNAPSMDTDEVPPLLAELPPAESAMDDGNTLVIDCHLHSNWRQLLLGSPGVDQQGRIRHIPGRLELVRAGQRVILKGADWQDLAFEQTIRQMLAQHCFESNGKLCPLPDDVQFYQMPVAEDELHSLFQTLCRASDKGPDKGQNPIIINESNISQWLNPIAIAPEGYAVPNTSLLEQIQAGGVVTVTSPLSEALWFHLLGSLQIIRETTGLEPRLQVACSQQQPQVLRLAENDELPLSVRNDSAFHVFTYQQPAQASYWINQHQAPLVIQINEQTSLNQLFDNIYITSEQKAHFGRSQSRLQTALTAGEPVVLQGLETNPTLAQLLEPLAVGQPLPVNGQLQAYPQAQVTILWPESGKSTSPVWRSIVAKGNPCPEIDLWDISGDKHDIPRTELPEQAVNKLYQAFKTVPTHLCNPLPELTEGLLNNLVLTALRAQQVDQSPQLLPRHWRKAINSVFIHGTRQNPSVHDFMKMACWQLLPDAYEKPDQPPSVDQDRLTATINSFPRWDRKCVKKHLWPLARAFDPAFFNGKLQLSYKNPLLPWNEDEILDRLCAMIVAHSPEAQRQAMASQLGVDPAATEFCQSLAIRPVRQVKRLQDALASGWQLASPLGQIRYDALHTLASDCFYIARTANSQTEGIERIKHRLSESLVWTGSADEPLSALAHDLYHGEISQQDRESRRLSRLHDRLADSPVIFLQGETGTGKSYFSAKMARASGLAAVISLGPSDSEQTLMKRWQWKQQADGDRSMEQQDRMLMKWANTSHDKDGEFVTLVLDEANLAQTGLLASLNGLWEPEPCIYVDGHPVPISKKHRVILTGNPDHYAGRQLDPTLKEKLPRAYYPRLDQAFLRDMVVTPALVNQLQQLQQRQLPESQLGEPQINDIARSATNSVMTLWQHYQELLPEHEFTPRDLTDICSWVGWYLDRSLSPGDKVTCGQMDGLIQQSFQDLLGPEVSEFHQDALSALNIWFAVRYEPDNTLRDKVHNHALPAIQETFRAVTKGNRPDFDTSGSAVCELAQRIGQDLSRAQQAYHHDTKHGGRQATLIEGPAGRGKDVTLDLMIKSIRQEADERQESMPKVFYLNACDCSWDEVCKTIQKAKTKGGIVVISELNLINSQHLEGELNNSLAGDAHPGFHLFATINPPEYSGRKPLSPALKGRFRHLPIRQYNPTELQAIAEKVLAKTPNGKSLAEQLTRLHCELRADLERKKLPLLPTSLDLQNVARAVINGEESLHQCFNQHYRLYLMAAETSLEKLLDSSTPAINRGAFDPELCHWLNQTVSGMDRPWSIRRSHFDSIDEKNHEIRVKDRPDQEEAKAEIIKRVAQSQWQASGLALEPDKSNHILTQTLYRRWQQRWFTQVFGRPEVEANSVFPLTKEQEQTLRMSAYQPYLKEADKQIQAWNAHDVQRGQAFWHQISSQLPHKAGDSGQYSPQAQWRGGSILDRCINYKDQKRHCFDYKIFNTEKPPSLMYRRRAMDTYVTAEGDIWEINLDYEQIRNGKVLTPDRLPGPDQELTLASNQTLANLSISSKNGRYELPSLTPDDYIVALRIETGLEETGLEETGLEDTGLEDTGLEDTGLQYTLVRDQDTGLHTLLIPGAKADLGIQVTYIVEPGGPDKKTPSEARPQPSTRFGSRCSEGTKNVLEKLLRTIEEQPSEIQEPLQAILDAEDTTQRIQAIKDYCEAFSDGTEPEDGENLFHFLVTQRQGGCRHRVPVFVAFCQYFGIPSRKMYSFTHSFAEYSKDGGQTWESVDLGGLDAQTTEVLSTFQPIKKKRESSTVLKKTSGILKDLLQSADSAQQQALAEACGMSLVRLKNVLDTNSASATENLSISSVMRNLWKRKDFIGFSMGISIMESLGQESPSYLKEASEPISQAIKHILSDSDEAQVIERLKSLHSKMMGQVGASPQQWLSLVMEILKQILFMDDGSTNPAVIQFVREAMELGWLDPLPGDKKYSQQAMPILMILLRLEGIDELRIEATHRLKQWYQTLLSRENSNQAWQSFYKRFRKWNDDIHTCITHGHGGVSSSLKIKIAETSLQSSWTDQPEGVPNIERLLVRDPAFEQFVAGKANHRPVIPLGIPDWSKTSLDEKTEALFQQTVENSPELKQLLEKINQYSAIKKQQELQREQIRCLNMERMLLILTNGDSSAQDEALPRMMEQMDRLNAESQSAMTAIEMSQKEQTLVDDLKNKCQRAIQLAFGHYLYELTHSKGGGLTYCWGDALFWGKNESGNYGVHDPSSPEELYGLLTTTNSSHFFQDSVRNADLRQVLGVGNALILTSGEITEIFEEFLGSVNLNSICESLGV